MNLDSSEGNSAASDQEGRSGRGENGCGKNPSVFSSGGGVAVQHSVHASERDGCCCDMPDEGAGDSDARRGEGAAEVSLADAWVGDWGFREEGRGGAHCERGEPVGGDARKASRSPPEYEGVHI